MIVKAYCAVHKKPFAISFAKNQREEWEAQNAFSISQERSKKGYGQDDLLGNILIGNNYPGCVLCGNKQFFLCNNCHTLNCQGTAIHKEDGHIYVTCANCGPIGYLQGTIESLNGFSDI